ncbi:hypothetical protein GYMLUDRAFT_725363 [Collybiopsis luxurians FD-317 M1]|nr:hypothetical protein GYMLUDRAFT_725363 [Collybiopsis luxurians FD-317 M1]
MAAFLQLAMRFNFGTLAFILLALLPLFVSACEGDCITDVTNEFLEKYQTPIKKLFDQLNTQLSATFPNNDNCASHLLPAYHNIAYPSLEYAIFPSYFHGKCQRPSPNGNGSMIDPPGCPNPDCPVVCGTPGSMVHFYSTLSNITYQANVSILKNITVPGSEGCKSVERCLKDANNNDRSRRFSPGISSRPLSRFFAPRFPSSTLNGLSTLSRRGDTQSRAQLQNKPCDIFQAINITKILSDICDESNDLSRCSWEKEMKAFILKFP